jgi:hypothetical protein
VRALSGGATVVNWGRHVVLIPWAAYGYSLGVPFFDRAIRQRLIYIAITPEPHQGGAALSNRPTSPAGRGFRSSHRYLQPEGWQHDAALLGIK